MSRRLLSTPHDYERIASLSLFIFHHTPYWSEFARISSFEIQTFSFTSTPDFDLRLLPRTTTRLHVSGRLCPRHPDDLASAFPIPALKQSTYSGKRFRSREPFRSLAKRDFRTTPGSSRETSERLLCLSERLLCLMSTRPPWKFSCRAGDCHVRSTGCLGPDIAVEMLLESPGRKWRIRDGAGDTQPEDRRRK